MVWTEEDEQRADDDAANAAWDEIGPEILAEQKAEQDRKKTRARILPLTDKTRKRPARKPR